MIKSYSIAEARVRLPAIVHEVEKMAAVELTRRGKPVAVLLSRTEYERLVSGKDNFWDAFQAFRERFDLEELAIEPDLLSNLRDASPAEACNAPQPR